MAENANERSGPSTSISPSNGRDTSLIQLYEQTTKTRERENSSRCINLKALEKVKLLSLFSKNSTAAIHSQLKCMQINNGKVLLFRLHSGTVHLEDYIDCVTLSSVVSAVVVTCSLGVHTDLLSHQN